MDGRNLGGSSGSSSLRSPEPVPVSAHAGDDPGRMTLAYDELHGCIIRHPGATCEVRKEFLSVALEALAVRIVTAPDGGNQ